MEAADLELFEHTESIDFAQKLVEYNLLDGFTKTDLSSEGSECRSVEEGQALEESVGTSRLATEHRRDNFSLFLEYFSGKVEEVGTDFITGWVVAKENNIGNVAVMLVIDGRYRARIVANNFRQDVSNAGYGDGYCGFKICLLYTSPSPRD